MMTMIEDWADLNASFTPQYPPFQDDGEGGSSNSYSLYGDPYGGGGGGDLGSESSVLTETLNSTLYTNSTGMSNDSNLYFPFGDDKSEPVIFDRPEVKAIFLVLYTIVFCSCFFGNLMVILVVTLHWRMRSITNFCLANLAFADLCVGIFCVYQNIVTYLMESWVFGEFMCKMYHFINSLSTTASVLILVVICIERYLAIKDPMTCKQILTLNRLRVTIVLVWILSAVISSPRFYYFSTITIPLSDGKDEVLCIPTRTKYDSKILDMISMVVLFLTPLGIISVLYTLIGIVLWRTSNTNMPAASASVESSSSSGCYYRETDNNLIQTVNLTLLPVNGVQPSPNRPTTLHGIPPSSTNTTLAESLHHHHHHSHRQEKKTFPFTCINCGKRARKQRQRNQKRKEQSMMIGQLPNPSGNELAMTSRNVLMDGNAHAPCVCHCHNNFTASVGGQDYHNSHPTADAATHYHNHPIVNGDCLGCHHKQNTETDDDNAVGKNKQENQERSDSPITTTCCGGKRCINPLRKHGAKKSVTFSTPPSPFCNRNCPCLDGKTSKTDPIVLVKFEKKQANNKKGRRSQCTILMNTKNIHTNACKCEGENNENNKIIANGTCVPESSCRPGEIECSAEEGNTGGKGSHVAPHGVGGNLRCGRNFCFEQTRDNMSVDSGISGMRPPTRHSIELGCCEQNFDSYSVGQAPKMVPEVVSQICQCQCSCEKIPTTSYQQHQPLKYQPPKSTATKRLRRLRIVKSSKYGTGALQSRRRIIRMLIVVVLAFALCHLPFHARKIWQYWSPPWAPYRPTSIFSQVFTPLTFLIMYVNSGINPILYAFMSKKFRMSFKDLLCCKMRHSLRISRNASVRSTHAVALSQTGC